MGYGVPAAVAMKRLYPQRTVLAMNGDGDFLMNGQEFATAIQYGLPIIALVLDNESLGTIRMHQEREYPGRVTATTLNNPDFAAMARSFGGFGATVEKTEDFAPAFIAARKVRPAGHHPCQVRYRRHFADDHAERHPRKCSQELVAQAPPCTASRIGSTSMNDAEHAAQRPVQHLPACEP